ncbi:hypothetical protein OEZ86_002342 [Tetradesmus obliquus]|nr:hypothetical protein OEZ86_002342 [Tetradesmus obliquus]
MVKKSSMRTCSNTWKPCFRGAIQPSSLTVKLALEKSTDLLAALPRRAALQASRAAPTHSVELKRKGISSSSSSNTGPLLALEEKIVRSSKQLKELVQSALRKRKTSATALNYNSSRSHVIITITVQQRKRIGSNGAAGVDDGDGGSSPASSPGASRRCSSSGSVTAEGSSTALESPRSEDDAAGSGADDGLDGEVFTHLTGKLYLVDLAGSESIKDSGAEGQQRVEACNINKSLSHLKTVISQWLKGRVATYRESLLTRRLQHALGGGNSKLLVIACISTARGNLAQTKVTLHFAQMARAIKNTPTVNRELKGKTVTRLQLQIEELQDQLAKAAVLNKGVGSDQVLLQQPNAVEAAYAELQEETEAKEASSGGSVPVLLPLRVAGLQESAAAAAAAAAVAEGGQTAAGLGSSWPSVYRPEHELASAAQRTAAQRAFDELALGTVVKLETLQTFLKGKELGGEPHSNMYSMPGIGSSAAEDVRVLQQGGDVSHRSSARHTQARAEAAKLVAELQSAFSFAACD